MSDDRLTEQPAPDAPVAQPTGFRPPTQQPGVWTREASQAVGDAIAIALVGLWFGLIPGILSGFPWAVLLPLLGLTIGGALGCLGGWLQYQRHQPTGTRVEEGGLPAATGQPRPSTTKPGLPSRAVTPRPTSLAPRPGLLRVGKLARHTGAVRGVSIAPDARTVVTCGSEGMVVCHDLESGFGVWKFEGFEHEGGRVAFSPDGQLLAVAGIQTPGGRDNNPQAIVHILEAHSGKPLRRLEFRSPPYSLCWLPDSRHLLVGTINQLRVWEVEQPAEITIIPLVTEMLGLEKAASLAVDSAGQLLLVGTVFTQNVRVL
jgi:WD40 repeat protein